MNIKLLKLMERDAHISPSDMATMLGLSEEEVRAEIEEMEQAKSAQRDTPLPIFILCFSLS